MRTTTDLYKLLGVPREATQDDIRKAHRELVRRYESQVTKSPEVIFSALLSEDGAHNVRFDRAGVGRGLQSLIG